METRSKSPREGIYTAIIEARTKGIAEKLVMKEVNIDITIIEKYKKLIEWRRRGQSIPPRRGYGEQKNVL